MQWGAPRYVAYVLQHSGAPVMIDLGAAEQIDDLIREFRIAASDPTSSDVPQWAAALSRRIIAPALVHLRNVRHLMLAPDGALNLVPMAALLDERDRPLIEHFEITYLTSGRDLLRLAGAEALPRGSPVIFAEPDYGRPLRVAAATDAPTGSQQRSADLDRGGGLSFRSLPGTALEAAAIKALLRTEKVRVLTGAQATEASLKQLHGPRILHLATHGFFLNDQRARRYGIGRSDQSSQALLMENPLLRSGVALAGANQRRSGANDDGILTALEASRLDLRGTQLVVLSACETGVGETRNGDGIVGLRRGLLLAGAQSQVSSLWKIADQSTQQLMVRFYEHLLRREGRSAALRSAQRETMAMPGQSHPYYWAGFGSIGDWKALSAGNQPR